MKIIGFIFCLFFLVNDFTHAQQAPDIIQIGNNGIMFPDWGTHTHWFLDIEYERKITNVVSFDFEYGHFTDLNTGINYNAPAIYPTNISRQYYFTDLGVKVIIMKSTNEHHYFKLIAGETFANVSVNNIYDNYYSGNPNHSADYSYSINGNLWGIKLGLAYYYHPIKNISLSPQFCIRWYDADEPSLDLNISVGVAF